MSTYALNGSIQGFRIWGFFRSIGTLVTSLSACPIQWWIIWCMWMIPNSSSWFYIVFDKFFMVLYRDEFFFISVEGGAPAYFPRNFGVSRLKRWTYALHAAQKRGTCVAAMIDRNRLPISSWQAHPSWIWMGARFLYWFVSFDKFGLLGPMWAECK